MSAQPVDVLAVLDEHAAECASRLAMLRGEIAADAVVGYEAELADLEAADRAAREARAAVADLLEASDRYLADTSRLLNTYPAGAPIPGVELDMRRRLRHDLFRAWQRCGGAR